MNKLDKNIVFNGRERCRYYVSKLKVNRNIFSAGKDVGRHKYLFDMDSAGENVGNQIEVHIVKFYVFVSLYEIIYLSVTL